MIVRNKLMILEFLRGIACIIVFLSHIRVGTQYFKDPKYDFIQLFTSWGKEAVIIFFILSGIVINLSTKNVNNRKEYLKKRLIRIYPIYFIVIIFVSLICLFVKEPISLDVVIGNLFFLGLMEGYIVPTINLNPAVWSITCEVFFYLIFAIVITGNRKQKICYWFVASLTTIIIKLFWGLFQNNILNFLVYLSNMSFIWLIGYLLYEYRNQLNTTLHTAMFCIFMIPLVTRIHNVSESVLTLKYNYAAIFLIPLFVYIINKDDKHGSKNGFLIRLPHIIPVYILNVYIFWQYSESTHLNSVIYITLPIFSFLFLFRTFKKHLSRLYIRILRPISFVAKISYPLYLLHLPIMYLFSHLFPANRIVGMGFILLTSVVFSYLLEQYFQKHVNKIAYPNRIF
jgi:peptidoglycan/LPS O-acetylase OafA/YrhL